MRGKQGSGSRIGNKFLLWVQDNHSVKTMMFDDIESLTSYYNSLGGATKRMSDAGLRKPPTASNTSGYKGVSFYQGKWHAKLTILRSTIRLGCYDSPLEAAKAYNNAVSRFTDCNAYLNKVDE